MDFARTNFYVLVPSTSIDLINVDSNLDDFVGIDKDTMKGIHIEDSNVDLFLWS